jgi:D-alanine-D-alanine ligase
LRSGNRLKVVVLYNFVGVDEYEALRQKVRKEEIVSPTGRLEDISSIATVKEEIEAIVQALKHEGFDSRAVNIKDDFVRLMEALTTPRPEVVFNLVEFFNDDALQEDRVAALYDLLRIPYTGSPPMTLSLCQRKALVKQILKAYGISTPRFKLVTEEPIPSLRGLRYPLIVKPAWEDASSGLDEHSVVDDRPQLEQRVRLVFKEFLQPALVEEFIEGRELGVSVLGNKPPRVLPIEEMVFTGLSPDQRGIISFESKWNPLHEDFHKGELVCPAKLSRTVARRAQAIALRTYQVMGCRDYSRIDMRLDRQNRIFVLEVNPNPDLTEGVAFMASAGAAGLSFSETLRLIVEEAWQRRKPAGPEAGESTSQPGCRQ